MPSLVAVALSGGVDSAVAAALLRKRGTAVLAVHLRLTDRPQAALAARQVAAALDIPFFVVDLREVFQKEVIAYFVTQYTRGLTPNPCIQCNAVIKFGVLWAKMQARGATHLATGHYARLSPAPDGEIALWRGADPGKDQSYFLQRLPRGLLPSLLFPLGGLTKGEVRRLFQELLPPGLQTLPESQEVCFIPPGGYPDFLREQAGVGFQPGDIVDPEGRFLGRHAGLIAFTVGQRRGIGIPARDPLYVLELQPEANRLVVGPKPALLAGGLTGVRANWLIEPPREEFAARAVIRYRHPGVAATIHPGANGSVTVRFAVPQAAVAPGQGVAFYQGDRLLGGAWIAEKLRE